MPATYAHYRFGFRTLPQLPAQVRSCIRKHRQMYDLGLHGPDFLFFHHPIADDKCNKLANQIHLTTGRKYFSYGARKLRLQPCESAASYLYGVLAHFALDSVCHPFIDQMSKDGRVSHMEIETELDRFLLELDGKPSPYGGSIARHIQLSSLRQAEEIAMFYPNVTPKQVVRSMKNFRFLVDFCTAPEGLRRRLIEKGVFSRIANEAMMKREADKRCVDITPELKNRYDQAEGLFPRLAQQLSAHLSHNSPFGSEFDLIFG